MEPVRFKGWNIEIAKDQKEYLPLPAFHSRVFNPDDRQGIVVSCWKLTLWERLKILFKGRVYFSQYTFNHSLQPQRPYVDNPVTPEAQAQGRPLDYVEPTKKPVVFCANCGRPAVEHLPPHNKCPKNE
jgi:hypothetical protein